MAGPSLALECYQPLSFNGIKVVSGPFDPPTQVTKTYPAYLYTVFEIAVKLQMPSIGLIISLANYTHTTVCGLGCSPNCLISF